ncbi:4-hydroxybutyrate coenzyme A transferase domain protein [Teladorsagia circumcincta]|uniref:4-hydroxybutyrate coenzyme A transferase domain protein n=1 Tax=Teladorsagia circumcincta TaxID=45464 RepID=A0A2G9UIT6_TELCI|nr:4-hydroxybutyrate coenzyme A transferase domain protein [Teladorsagia circumcincta]
MPRTYGDTVIHISQIDSLVEVNDREIYAKPDRGKPNEIVTSYGYGSRKFYDVINNNPLFHFESCEWTNRPEVIRANSKMTCINACIEIDLTGQVASDSIGGTLYSGFGGQVDFISSASTTYDGKGKAIIALPSRTSKGKPKIVAALPQNAGVVTTRGHVQFVVTEYGIADLAGKNVRQRAYELIKIAHPDDRQLLEKQAFERLKCMPSL